MPGRGKCLVEPGADYEFTVEWIDKAITCVQTVKDGAMDLEFYVRDPQASRMHMQVQRHWDLPDGAFPFDEQLFQQDNYRLYAVGTTGLRNELKAKGMLDRLGAAANQDCGILAWMSEDGLSAAVVQGRNRPSLSCQTLFGEVTARPYPDERMEQMRLSGMSFEQKLEAAKSGDIGCLEAVAMGYLEGEGVATDLKAAAQWMERLAEAGSAVGQFNMGLFCAKGCGVPRDFERAAEWMRRAEQSGSPDARSMVKLCAEMADNRKRAEAGDVAAQTKCARAFMVLGGSLEQMGPGSDYDEAFRWAKRASDAGNPEAAFLLGLCYDFGRGVEQNEGLAAQAYQKGAEAGDPSCQWNLAMCYRQGSGVNYNEGKAILYAYKAADQGYQPAVDGLQEMNWTLSDLIQRLTSPDLREMLEGTQYEGRVERCEHIRIGDELQLRRVRNNPSDENAIEFLHRGGSVGLMSRYQSSLLAPLMDLDLVEVKARVKSCLPKSQRGPRARNAEVGYTLVITEKKRETPEEREARLEKERAEAEVRRRAEEEARQRAAEEEERRKAEEERQRVLEAQRKEEARSRYRAEKAAWEAQRDAIDAQRQARLAQQMVEERQRMESQLSAKRDEAVRAAEAELEKQSARKRDAESTLAGLGLFSFGAKKAQRQAVEEAERLIGEAKAKKARAEDEYRKNRDSLERELASRERSVRAAIEAELPIPEAPKDPDAEAPKPKSAASPAPAPAPAKPAQPARPMTQVEMENERLKQAILQVLAKADEPLGVFDITRSGLDMSGQKCSALMSQLVREGRAEKVSVGAQTCFRLPTGDASKP